MSNKKGTLPILLFQKFLFPILKFSYYKNAIKFMTYYSEKVFHLSGYRFVFKRSAVSGYPE